jgi:hypothetical protein
MKAAQKKLPAENDRNFPREDPHFGLNTDFAAFLFPKSSHTQSSGGDLDVGK